MLRNVHNNNVDVIFMQIQSDGVLELQTLKQLSDIGIKMFNFSGDVRTPLPNWYLEVAPYCVTLFTNEHDVELIKNAGYRAEFFQVGYNQIFYNNHSEVKKEADIVFFGNNYPNHFPLSHFRYEIASGLKQNFGDNFKIYGNQWDLPSRDMNFKQIEEGAIYRGAKIGINLSHFNYGRYSSDRIFRIMSCGTMCLSHRYKNIHLDFKEGEHLRTWENLDELLDLINFYLINDSERLAIAKKGNEYVEKYFTWEYRISNQLKQIIYDLDNKN
jgi:spore maturation protein CgeB